MDIKQSKILITKMERNGKWAMVTMTTGRAPKRHGQQDTAQGQGLGGRYIWGSAQ